MASRTVADAASEAGKGGPHHEATRDVVGRRACGVRQPPERTRCTRSSGTRATSFSSHANGESFMPVVLSAHGFVKLETQSPVDLQRRSS